MLTVNENAVRTVINQFLAKNLIVRKSIAKLSKLDLFYLCSTPPSILGFVLSKEQRFTLNNLIESVLTEQNKTTPLKQTRE